MDDDRLARLEARIADLERRMGSEPETARPVSPATEPLRFESTPATATAPIAGGSFERFVAGRGLQIAGVVLVLLGTAFFLELAFTRGWIGPVERILLGLATGSALVLIAAKRVGAAYPGLAEALIGLGSGILYLSLWASVAVFPELHVSRLAAFAAMAAVTAWVAALANARRSERLAFLALIGGFITPLLLASGSPDTVTLAAYVLLLTSGALILAARRGFVVLEAGTLLATLCYAPAFAPLAEGYGWGQIHAIVLATLLFTIFATAWTVGYMSFGASRLRLALLAVNFGCYALALEAILAERGTTLGFALLALAAVAVGVAQIRSFPRALSRSYGYLGLGAITLALPTFVHETNLSLSFTLESIALVALGMGRDIRLARAGLTLLAVMGSIVVGEAFVEPQARSFGVALGFAAWLAGGAFVLRNAAKLGMREDGRQTFETLARIAFDFVAITGLSRLCLDVVGGPEWRAGIPSVAQFALSLIWTGYATLLFISGLRRRSELLRWEGLALFGATVIKVFLVDLASVDVPLRIGSFVTVGIVLVAVSALYTRSMANASRREGGV